MILAVAKREARGTMPPTGAKNSMVPEPAERLKENAPSIVFVKIMFPPSGAGNCVVRVPGAVKVMGPTKLILSLLVLIVAPSCTDPAPVWLKGPSRVMGDDAAVMFKRPALLIVRGPPFVVVTV